MRKILLLLLMLIPVMASAQIGRFPFYRAPVVAAAPSNMISNGTFDNTDDWSSIGADWTISDGVANYADTQLSGFGQDNADMISSIKEETDYRITFTINISGANEAVLYFLGYGTGTPFTESARFGNGNHQVDFTTPTGENNAGLYIRASANSDEAFSIDNIVLIEL